MLQFNAQMPNKFALKSFIFTCPYEEDTKILTRTSAVTFKNIAAKNTWVKNNTDNHSAPGTPENYKRWTPMPKEI